MLTRLMIVPTLFVLIGIAPLAAQQPDSGTINVTVQEPMGLVEDALVRCENRSARTDGAGADPAAVALM